MTYPQKRWLDVVSIISGKAQRAVESNNGKYPIYGSGGVIGRANSYLCDAGTTIIGRKGTINAPIFVNEKFWNVDTAFGIKPSEQLVPKFLFYFCEHFNFKELDKSTTIPSVAKRDLLNISMPVPAKSVQELIVAKIEELFSDLDKAVDALQTIRQQVAVYRQAVLKDAFIKQERKELLSKYVGSMQNGISKRKSEYGDEVVVLRLSDVANDTIDETSLKRTIKLSKKERDFYCLKPSDLLIIRVNGSVERVGRVILNHANNEYAFCDHFIRCRVNVKLIMPKFIKYLCDEYNTRVYLEKNMVSTAGQNTINQTTLYNIPVCAPSLEKQKEIVRLIESRLSVCDSIERTVDIALQQAATLRQSILKQAFEGKLIP